MPNVNKRKKLKTKKSAAKRFKITGSGLVLTTQMGKQHNMRKRSKKFIRNQRGMIVIDKTNVGLVEKMMPYRNKKRK